MSLDRAALLAATAEALVYLRDVVRQTPPSGRSAAVGVQAAARICEMHRWLEDKEDLDRSFVKACGGPEKAAAWLIENAERLSRRLGVQLPALQEPEGKKSDAEE